MKKKSILNKWCIAHVFMTFSKLKDHCKTEDGRRSVLPGEWFMPLSEDLRFRWLSLNTPKTLFHIATKKEIREHFKDKELNEK